MHTLFAKSHFYKLLGFCLVLFLANTAPLLGGSNPVVAGFTADKMTVSVGETVTFTDTSTDNNCNGASDPTRVNIWNWNFGVDATPATENTQGPHNVTYSSVGTKTVTLDVDDSANTCDPDPDGFSRMITVTGPDVPTLSEWALILLALLLMNLGSIFIAQEKFALATSRNFKLPFSSLQLPFSAEHFNKAVVLTAIFAFVGFVGSIALTGTIAASDLIGVFVTAPVFAYLVHLVWLLKGK